MRQIIQQSLLIDMRLTSKYWIRWEELLPIGPEYICSPPNFRSNNCKGWCWST